jgi:hypothetical protein
MKLLVAQNRPFNLLLIRAVLQQPRVLSSAQNVVVVLVVTFIIVHVMQHTRQPTA